MNATTLLLYLSVALTGGIVKNVWSAPKREVTLSDKSVVVALAFSPTGKSLAVSRQAPLNGGYTDAAVELWDLDNGTRLRVLQQAAWNGDAERTTGMYVIGAVEFSPDGKWLVATDSNGYVVWSMETGSEKVRWRSGVTENDLRPGWSSDSKRISLPSMEQERFALTNGIAVIDFGSLKRTAFFPVELGYARTARISADSRLLVTAGHDCTVRVFDLRTNAKLLEDSVQTTMFAAAISPDGRTIIAGSSWAGVFLRYGVNQSGAVPAIAKAGVSEESREEIHLVEFAQDGKVAVSTSAAGVRLWDAKNWTLGKQIKGYSHRLSPDSKYIALVRETRPNSIEVWVFEEWLK